MAVMDVYFHFMIFVPGSAEDSECADALAEKLLALVSVDEQRNAMELLRIRASGITELTEQSQRLLATSKFVASHLANATDLDWSAAIVCICKAVEVELIERLIEPLALECRDADLDDDIQTSTSGESPDSVPVALTSHRSWGSSATSSEQRATPDPARTPAPCCTRCAGSCVGGQTPLGCSSPMARLSSWNR